MQKEYYLTTQTALQLLAHNKHKRNKPGKRLYPVLVYAFIPKATDQKGLWQVF